jgi:hypothetical protein|tara:strand:+ start:713 stop:937 length:225 start_codon:yes stop_codon:yes gene_type:complete
MIDSFLSDLQLLIEDCEMNDKQIGEMVNAADELGVSINYFIEEFFVFENPRVHDDDYISLDTFNTVHGIYFEEE